VARLAAGTFALVVLLTACGGGKHNAASVAPSTSSPSDTTSTTVNPIFLPGGSSTTTRPASGASTPTTAPYPGSGSTTLPTGAQGVPRAPLAVHMAKSCVRHGDTQTITVKSTPNFQVSLATQWPDGAGHLEYNGWAIGRIPPNGTFTKSWTIPAGAALGQARTDVEVTNDNGSQVALDHPTWKIADKC